MSIKVSKWNIAVLHSGLEPQGESSIQHTHTVTHTYLHSKVNTITAESTPIFVIWHRSVSECVLVRETEIQRERQQKQLEKGLILRLEGS